MIENERLSAKQTRAIDALLVAPTIRAAAKAAKVSEATLWRWLNEPAFDRAYREIREKLLKTTITALQARGNQAVQTLVDVMEDALSPAGSRVQAARAILELSIKSRELIEMEERLRAIEERLEDRRKLNLA